jgi:acetyl-CoA synthetase
VTGLAAGPGNIGPVVWRPTDEVAAGSGLLRLAAKLGADSVEALQSTSNLDPARFWSEAVDDLGIDFYTPYRDALDLSEGVEFPRWWRGGSMNIVHSCLDRYAGTAVDTKVALVWESEAGEVRELTYGQLRTQVDRVASGLASLGVRTGDRVGLFMPMIPEVAVAVLATAKIGAVLVPMFSGYGAEAVAARLVNCDAKVLICADGFARRGSTVAMKAVASAAADLVPTLEHVVVVDHAHVATSHHPRDIAWEKLPAGAASPATVALDPEDPLLIIYTSGTTGAAKGTVHTHGGFPVKGAADLVYGFDGRSSDRIFWFTDIGWMMGPWLIYGSLILGATMVMYEGSPDTPTADRLWQIVDRHQVSIFGLSPTLVRSLMNAPSAGPGGHDLSSLRVVGATGELWDWDSWTWCFEHVCRETIPLLNYCGGTELAGGILCGNVVTPLRPLSFAGPIPGMFADVVDATGTSVVGEVGELVLRGPNPGMTRGFWKDRERYLESYWSRFPGVWVHGDWAYVDADDHLWYVLGRSDDTIKVAGKRVGPGEVESLLNSDPAVAASAAVGVSDTLKGERLVCFVVLRQPEAGATPVAAALADRVAAALGKPMRPSAVEVVADLPRTRNAKIVRKAIRLAYSGEPIADLSAIENPESLVAIADAGKGRR